MRQAPCQPNLLNFSNMCRRNYPAPSDIYLLPNPAVARLAPTNASPARMMSQRRWRQAQLGCLECQVGHKLGVHVACPVGVCWLPAVTTQEACKRATQCVCWLLYPTV